ncbi:glycoside hydrolase family 2 protein [Paenibacillus chartarius]|uniref:Glycoside hydrolase family 2 protein n=1 Tax=Paenibacillus chartarius TaxID=747481 RepID=A0ABV6DDX2_9BACL
MGATNGQDQFAEIAFREHPGHPEQLRDIPPVIVNKSYFRPSVNKAADASELPYEAQLTLFHEELKRLREKYAPFMINSAAAPAVSRDRRPCDRFQFRYQTPEDADFTRVLDGAGDWESVTIPDFRGPTGENGKWTGFYRCQFAYGRVPAGKRVYLVFKGVDYKTTVYLNHKCVGSHEGFFAPFEFDVTDYLQDANTLVVEVQNDYPMLGVNGTKLDGDKIYAATGPGWDDPNSGWNHCPPGAGIYNSVYLEQRPELFIQDVFVRPNIDDGSVEVWVDAVNTTSSLIEQFELQLDIMPRNFTGPSLGPLTFQVAYAGPGINYFRYKAELPEFRLWEPEQPWLYTARIGLRPGTPEADSQDRVFGMRKFHMDEEGEPKGTLYLNNRPILLRGANEMGHLQQCVMTGNFEQLIDDILIAKLAHMNYYRITQRPVQEEIYDYFDMLGMMHQCDLPTFGFIRRNQFAEGVRQAAEMERLIRSHPSSIMVSLINEPSRTEKRRKGHRHLHRSELEAFFVASRQAIYVENPDRVVKNAEGDYNPPTREGLPDFHCYNMWYTNNVISVGKMYKGYLPPIRDGWKAGCGEYGTEGLDRLELMKSRYPQEWLPAEEGEPWQPRLIHGAQTFSLHGDWYAEQGNIRDWIEASQHHQMLATKLMTDAWRRRADRIVSTAIHLLIDAWPAGWMKALVGVDRIPKPAYFTYKACLEPVRVNLRCDRWKAYEGETLEVEAWLLNDTAVSYEQCRIVATLRDDNRDYGHYELPVELPAASSAYAGSVRLSVPQVADRKQLYVDACLQDGDGRTINAERFGFEAFAKPLSAAGPRDAVCFDAEAELLCSLLGLQGRRSDGTSAQGAPLVVASREAFVQNRSFLLNEAKEGATVLCVLKHADGGEWQLEDTAVGTAKLRDIYALAVRDASSRFPWLRADDFAYFYNLHTDRIDGIAGSHLTGEGLEPLVFAYDRQGGAEGKRKLPLVAVKAVGRGQMFFVCLPLSGRVGVNPTLDRLLLDIVHSYRGCSACTPLLAEIGNDEQI